MHSAGSLKRFLRVVSETVLVSFLCGVLVLGLTWPAVANLKTNFISDGGDLYLFAMHRVQEAWQLGEYPFGFTKELRFPVGYDFGVGIDAIAGVLIGAWLLGTVGDPVMSYNLAVLIILVINIVGFYWLSKVVSKSRLVGMVGAVMGGYSWYVVARAAGHLNLVFVAGWPVVALGAWWVANRRPRLGVLLLYLGTWFLLWGSLQYVIMVTIVAALFVLAGSLTFPSQTKEWFITNFKLWWLHLLFIPFLITALLWPFWPTLTAIANGSFQNDGRGETETLYESSLPDLFLPSKSYSPTLMSLLPFAKSQANIETTTFLGIIEILGVVLFFTSKVQKKPKIAASLLLLFFIILTLGKKELGIPLPFAFLGKIFPFSGIAEPARFVVILTVLLTLCVVTFLHTLKKRAVRIIISSLLLGVLLLERIPYHFYQAAAPSRDTYTALAAQSGTAVLHVPLNLFRQDYSFTPIFTDKSIVNGYIHWSTNTPESKAFIDDPSLKLGRFHCDAQDPFFSQLSDPAVVANEKELNNTMLAKLKAAGVTQLVIHTDADFFHSHCASVRARLGLLLPSEEVLRESTTTKPYLREIANGRMTSTLYAAKDGILGLHAVSLSGKHATVSALLRNSIIDFPSTLIKSNDQEWIANTEDGNTGKAFGDFTYQLRAGDRFTVTSPEVAELGGVTIWYDFTPTNNSLILEPAHPLEKVFDDGVRQIYYLQ